MMQQERLYIEWSNIGRLACCNSKGRAWCNIGGCVLKSATAEVEHGAQWRLYGATVDVDQSMVQ
jgi:hypothetical protein